MACKATRPNSFSPPNLVLLLLSALTCALSCCSSAKRWIDWLADSSLHFSASSAHFIQPLQRTHRPAFSFEANHRPQPRVPIPCRVSPVSPADPLPKCRRCFTGDSLPPLPVLSLSALCSSAYTSATRLSNPDWTASQPARPRSALLLAALPHVDDGPDDRLTDSEYCHDGHPRLPSTQLPLRRSRLPPS